MKRIFFSIIFILVAGLFLVPSFNKTFAGFCNPLFFNLGYGCVCSFNAQCASGYCHWPVQSPPIPAGVCAVPPQPPPTDPAQGGVSPISLTVVRFPVPEPPCVNLSSGLCRQVNTSLGNIDVEPGAFITRLFGIMLAASGAIAVILILRAGYRIMTARGNPEGIQKGREQLVSAIIGLMFLVLSFVLLQVIAVDLLKIPGISGGPTSSYNTCSDAGGTCGNATSCATNGGTILGAMGCTGSSEIVCCKTRDACRSLGGFCAANGLCRAEGGTSKGRQNCSGSNICCTGI